MDYLATLQKLNVAGHGYGALFANTTLDRYWKPDLTVEQAVDVMKKAIAEVGLRLVVAQPKYIIKVVDKDGIRTVAEPSG